MMFETTSSFAESMIISVMMWTFAVCRALWKISSAHSIILMALLISVLANAVFTSKDTSGWWAERNAAKFMSRVGVGPNPMMSKAIYLKDLDDAITALPTELMGQSGSKCYAQFRDIANVTDMDADYQTVGIHYSEKTTKSTAQRLRRTRQNLGSYRHDLLVAMRVVNNVEREMLKAEWENWLLDENKRCKQVYQMLQEANRTVTTTPGKKNKESQQAMVAKEKEKHAKLGDLRRWHQDYCNSCRMEQEFLVKGWKHLAFG